MPSLKERISGRVDAIRQRRPFLDHLVRMIQHYGAVRGNLQAGAVTYFAFLSFFPILALAFAVVGLVSRAYPDAEKDLVDAIGSIFPNIVGDGQGEVSLESIEESAPGILSVGLPVVLYAGLGWLSGMRDALLVVFEKPRAERPNFVFGKFRDIVTLALIGATLMVSVAVAGVVEGFSEDILGFVGLGDELGWLLRVVTVVVGLGANMLLFFALFRLLAAPDAPNRSLWSGALLGAIGFEALKQASTYLLASTKDQPAFQAFGIALILVVWINYFSRVVMYAAAWAHTARQARVLREQTEQASAALAADSPSREGGRRSAAEEPAAPAAFAAGAAVMLGAVALARRTTRKGRA